MIESFAVIASSVRFKRVQNLFTECLLSPCSSNKYSISQSRLQLHRSTDGDLRSEIEPLCSNTVPHHGCQSLDIVEPGVFYGAARLHLFYVYIMLWYSMMQLTLHCALR